VNVNQSKLTDFLATAEELKVKGLSQGQASDQSSSKRRPVSEGGPVRKKSKQSPILPRVDPLNALVVLDIKKPPPEDNDHIIIPELKTTELSDIVDDSYTEEYSYGEHDFTEYSSDHFSKDDSIVDPHFEARIQVQQKRKRQQILNFLNQNKRRLENSYQCLLCNKESTDNSNMNKHVEFTHHTELKNYLENVGGV